LHPNYRKEKRFGVEGDGKLEVMMGRWNEAESSQYR